MTPSSPTRASFDLWMRAMLVMMNNARRMICCQGIQIGERATQQAQRFAAERLQSALAGSPDRTPVTIDKHPDVRRMLWRMRAQTEAARALVHYAAAQLDSGRLGDDAAAMRAEILTQLSKAHDLGRTSVTERACRYVETSAVAVYLKKAA